MIQKTILVKAAAAVMGTAVIAGAAAAVNHMLKPKNSYRSILLYEIEGTARDGDAERGRKSPSGIRR